MNKKQGWPGMPHDLSLKNYTEFIGEKKENHGEIYTIQFPEMLFKLFISLPIASVKKIMMI